MGKVLIIGLDGATWDVLGRLVEAGSLRNLATLMKRGAWGTLHSTIPPVTLPAWSSFMTGKNPGAHGVFGFRRTMPDRYEEGGLANASDVRSATMWEIAGEAGRHVGVISVPPSYPLPEVNGFVVGCMLTPAGEPIAAPPDVAQELAGYTADVRPPLGLRRGQPDYVQRGAAYLGALAEQTRERTAATVRLMKRPWDLLCVVYYAPDRMQHYFWPYLEKDVVADEEREIRQGLDQVFRALDDALGTLAAEAGPETTLILVSDHGCGAKPDQAVYVNRWLANRGLLRERPLWRLRRKLLTKIMSRARRLRYDTDEHRVDRRRTRAWAETLDPTTVGIWINDRGRYPLGCVGTKGEYEDVRRRLIDDLRALTDRHGRRVFSRVDRREDVYRGAFVGEAPDIVGLCERAFGVIYGSLRRDLRAHSPFGPFEELGFTGTHDVRGMYLFAGPSIEPLGAHQEYPIESVAPTTLHLLGLPVPRSMEGPVCASLFRGDFLREHPVRYTDDDGGGPRARGGWKSSDDEARIREHLHALGYVE
jgi:predicted AlkP superfamily phosphohydrolase/phosphomutase